MSTRSYDVDMSHRGREAEIHRLAAQASLGWGKEARTLSWFGLEDGMSLLELGSGPGFITRRLLDLVPNSTITCLEIDPSLVKQAEQYLHDEAGKRVTFVTASVMDTKLPADHFDFAYARLLFQHLPDPLGAARETLRLLKPGGKFVIYDIDDAMFGLVSPPVPEWPLVLERFGQAQAARGGDRNIGRRLWRILESAGFQNLDLEVIAFHSDDLGIEAFLPQMDPDRLLPLRKAGLLTEEELERVRSSYTRFLAAAKSYVLMLSLMVSGEKPAR